MDIFVGLPVELKLEILEIYLKGVRSRRWRIRATMWDNMTYRERINWYYNYDQGVYIGF